MDYEQTFTRRYEYRRLAKTSTGEFTPINITDDTDPLLVVKGCLTMLLFTAMLVVPSLLGLN